MTAWCHRSNGVNGGTITDGNGVNGQRVDLRWPSQRGKRRGLRRAVLAGHHGLC